MGIFTILTSMETAGTILLIIKNGMAKILTLTLGITIMKEIRTIGMLKEISGKNLIMVLCTSSILMETNQLSILMELRNSLSTRVKETNMTTTGMTIKKNTL